MDGDRLDEFSGATMDQQEQLNKIFAVMMDEEKMLDADQYNKRLDDVCEMFGGGGDLFELLDKTDGSTMNLRDSMYNYFKAFRRFYGVDNLCKVFDEIGEMFKKGEIFEFAKGFNAMKSDFNKVKYVASLPFMKDLSFHINFLGKDEDSALGNRNLGHSDFSDGKFTSALCHYNLSILISSDPTFSPKQPQSESMSLGYFHRSELLFSQCRYADALLDIDRALKCGLPSDFHLKLWKCKGECYYAIGSYDQAIKCFDKAKNLTQCEVSKNELQDFIDCARKSKLKKKKPSKIDLSNTPQVPWNPVPVVHGGVNPTVSSASKSLAVVSFDDQRKRVIATKDIPPGEPVIVEEPFVHCLAGQFQLKNCYYCLRRTDVPIPCRQCRTVFYCGEDCRDNSWKLDHKFSCKILHSFRSKRPDTYDLQNHLITSLKVIIKVGRDRLKYLFEQENGEQKVKGKEQPCAGSRDFKSVLNILEMEANEGECWALEEFKAAIYSIILLTFLDLVNLFETNETQVPDEKSLSYSIGDFVSQLTEFHFFVGSLIFKQLLCLQFRGRYITEEFVSKTGQKPEKLSWAAIGFGVFELLCQLEHSCDPNTLTVFRGSTAVCYSTRSIFKGEELTDNNMGCKFRVMDLSKRTEIHQKLRKFECGCVVCVENWPVENKMPSIRMNCYPRFKSAKMSKEMFSKQFFSKPNLDRYNDVLQLLLANVTELTKRSEKEMSKVLKCYLFLEKHTLKPYQEILKVELVLMYLLAVQGTRYIELLPDCDDKSGRMAEFERQWMCGSITTSYF